jgi:hypothetical protein
MKPFVRNIIKCYSSASKDELRAGREWYGRAESLARELCPKDVNRGAGVIAALSPRQTWETNVKGARLIIRAADNGSQIIPSVAGTYMNINKAWNIANGEDPMKTFTSGTRCNRWLKVQRFFKNITGNSYVCTIDVWAARAANPLCTAIAIGGRMYLEMEASYQEASRWIGGISPRDLQAVCWVHTRGSAE